MTFQDCPQCPCVPDQATPLPEAEPANPYFFTGRRLDVVHDDTGQPAPLYYYRARHYDPVHGRFLQRDPAGYVDGINLYEYVSSRPTGFLDPTGRWKWADGGRDPSRPRAVVVAEPGDTVVTLSRMVGLDPDEFRMWMQPEPTEGGPMMPGHKHMALRANCRYSIPNTVYVHQGANKWYVGGFPAFLTKRGYTPKGKGGYLPWDDPFLAEEMRDFRDDFEQQGFMTVLRIDVTQATVLTDLADPDIHGWAMGGHADFGVMFTSDDRGVLPGDMNVFDPNTASVQRVLNHKLAIIVHYGCFSFNPEWLQYVAPGGDYYSFKGKIYPWHDWYDLYHDSPQAR
jgi:RHS repeat-associated protein